MSVFIFKKFDGGLQEDSVGAAQNQVKRFQNLRLNGAGNSMSQYGRALDSTDASLYKVSADSNGYQRINTLVPYKIDSTDELLKHVGNKLVWNNGGTYSEIKSPVKKETGCVVYSGTYCIFIPGRKTHGIGIFTRISDFTDDNFTATNGNILNPYATGYTWSTSVNDQIANPTVGTTAASTTATVSSAASLTKGMRINDVLGYPSAFPDDTYITNISGLNLTMSQAATATVSRVMYFSADVVVPHAFVGSSTNLTLYFWGEQNFRERAFAALYGQTTDPFSPIAETPSFNCFYSEDEHAKISKALFDNHLYITDQTLRTNPMVVLKNSNTVDGIGANQVCAVASGLPRPMSGKTVLFLPNYKSTPETIKGVSSYVQLNSSTTAQVPLSSITFSNGYTSLIAGMNIFATTPTGSNPIPAGTYITAISVAGDILTLTLNQAATATGIYKCEFVQEDMLAISSLAFAPLGGAAANSGYSWAFVYSYTYTFNGKAYKTYGRPLYLLSSKYHAQYYPTLGAEGSVNVSLDPTFLCPSNGFKRTVDPITSFDPDAEDIANRQLVGVDSYNVTLEVYRTAANGNIFYLYGTSENRIERKNFEVLTVANTWSINNRTLYTTSGVAANYRPPICKYITASGPFMYYANGHEITESDRGGDLLKNRVWQAKPGLPYAVPADFYADVDEEIVGLATVKTVPIVFTQNYVYRIEGSFDSFGRGGMEAKRITEITGCVSDTSIVQTEDGIYFAGTDGFYFTDGFVLKHLSKNIIDTYRGLISSDTKKALISGGIDILNREIHWTAQVSDVEGEGTECNASFVYDIENDCILGPHTSGFDDFNASNGEETVKSTLTSVSLTSGSDAGTVAIANVTGILEKGQVVVSSALPFGTRLAADPVVSGANYNLTFTRTAYATGSYNLRSLDKDSTTWMFFEQFMPTCYAYMGGELYYGDPRGYTFKYDRAKAYNDVIDEGNTTASTWEINPIKYHLATVDSDFGVGAYKKWVSRATLKLRYSSDVRSNLSVQPATEREANGLITNTSVLEDTNNTPWGYSSIAWGSPLLFSTASDVKDYQVHMPKDAGLRSTYRSMHLTNADVVIQESGSMATQATVATVSGNVKSLTISSATNWYGDILGYYVKFFEIDANGDLQYLFGGKKFWAVRRFSDTVLYVLDEDADLVNASSYDFEVRGMRKDDVIELQEIDYYFTPIGQGQENGGQAPSSSGA